MDVLARIKKAPKEPGVYTWRDTRGRAIYIGKATSIKSRLSNYPKTTDSRIQAMMQEAATLSWQTTDTDIEALILESQLIKKYKPKFNIVMRDDKQYFFVALTDERFPTLTLTHQARSAKLKKPVKELIGPFTDGTPLKSTLRTLRGLFPYCTCKRTHHLRCLNAHMGICPGYCCLKSPATPAQKREYTHNIRAIRDILTGKRDTLITRLEKEMKSLAAGGDLERAIDLQKKIERIKRVFQNAQINARHQQLAGHTGATQAFQDLLGVHRPLHRIEGYDIANIQQTHTAGSMVVFTDGVPDKAEYRLFNIEGSIIGDVPQLSHVLARRLAHQDWPTPDLILVDGARGQLNAVLKALAKAELSIPVIALTKNDKHQGDHVLSSLDRQVRYLKDLPRPIANLIVHIDGEAHRFAISHYRRRHGRAAVRS